MGIGVLDLFSGCGGMSWGLYKAGMNIVAAIDNNSPALDTFRLNHPNAVVSCEDLSVITPESWLKKAGLETDAIDCIIGGPPCQGFSKNVPRKQRFLDDERNLLVKNFLEFVRVIRPKTVIIENVAEMINGFDGAFTDEILSTLSRWGYSAGVKKLDAADYGIPQHRKRAFFFGSQEFEVSFPKPTHCDRNISSPLFKLQEKEHVSVWDAIGDLPALRNGEGVDPAEYKTKPLTAYQMLMRQSSTVVHNHVARKMSKIQLERLSSIGPGEGANELPSHLKPKSSYSGAYGRLTKDMVARTLTRWMFHPGSGRFGHPVDIRTITIREAARLQSFSDDFVFTGSFTQASSQIGNAVPPLLMARFASIILENLGSECH